MKNISRDRDLDEYKNRIRKHPKCPMCKGLMFHDIDHSECCRCGFYISKDCCRGSQDSEKEILTLIKIEERKN